MAEFVASGRGGERVRAAAAPHLLVIVALVIVGAGCSSSSGSDRHAQAVAFCRTVPEDFFSGTGETFVDLIPKEYVESDRRTMREMIAAVPDELRVDLTRVAADQDAYFAILSRHGYSLREMASGATPAEEKVLDRALDGRDPAFRRFVRYVRSNCKQVDIPDVLRD